MHIAITLEIDAEVSFRSALIQNVSDSLANCVSDKSYGEDIETLYIGLICQRPAPCFEAFQRQRNSRYIARKTTTLLDGTAKEIRNVFSYDIKFDFEKYIKFIKSDEVTAFEVLKALLIKSLSKLDSLPKKVKHFDVALFRVDFAKCLDDMKA